jgi:hypothetical protein
VSAPNRFVTTRWITGGSYRHGYVYEGKKVLWSCRHKHKTTQAAKQCAERQLHELGLDDIRRAKAAFDKHRDQQEALGFEVCLVIVGYASGREPFRLLGRVSADTGRDSMPDPPLTAEEMQPVAFAAKMALAKVLSARKR